MRTLSDPAPAAARQRVVDWLGELGPRWGLPAASCRVHGWLFLNARAAPVSEIAMAVGLDHADTEAALAWLKDHGLADRDQENRWRTGDDPWELVMRALERRRDRELAPALEILRTSRAEAASDPVLAARIQGLLDLLADIVAIDSQARRLSSRTLRRLIGAGARAARLFGGTSGSRRNPDQ